MTASTRYLFVYGSLRRGGKAPLNRLLHRKARWIGKAWARGALYRIAATYPGFVPSRRGGAVTGDLFDIGGRTALLAMLDCYEECTPDFPEPQEYRHVIIRVRTQSRALQAWAYIYAWPTSEARRIRTGDFLR